MILVLAVFISGCSKQEITITPIDPKDRPSIIEWVWETELSGWMSYTGRHNPLLYEDKLIIPTYGYNREAKDLYVLNTETGDLEVEFDILGERENVFTKSIIVDESLVLNGSSTVKCLNLPDLSLRWEIGEDATFVGTQLTSFESSVYNGGSSLIDGIGFSVYNEINLTNGSFDPVLKEQGLNETDSKSILYPYIEMSGMDTIATYLIRYLPHDIGPVQYSLTSFNMTKGTVIWQTEKFGVVDSYNFLPPKPFNDDLILMDDLIVYSFNRMTGDLNWSSNLRRTENFQINSLHSISVVDDKIYLTNINGILFCLDASTGNRLWTSFERDKIGLYSGPAPSAQDDFLVKDGILFINSAFNGLILINAENGEVIECYSDDHMSGQNIIYDEGLDLFYITCRASKDQPGRVKAFRLKR